MPIYKSGGKKDGLQRYRIRVTVTDASGKTRQIERVAYGLENAKNIEQELQADKNRQTGGRTPTLNDLAAEFNASRLKSVRETTRAKNIQAQNSYILPILGENRINRLPPSLLQQWKNELDNTDLSLLTKQRIYGELRALLNFAVKMDYIPTNPLTKVGNFRDALAAPCHKINFYTPDEFHRFINAARCAALKSTANEQNLSEWHYYVFFNIAFYTGLRKGEINALTWQDICDNTLTVSKSVAQKLKGEDRITPPKNKSSYRTLQIPTPLMNILIEHKTRCQQLPDFSETKFICGYDRPLRDSTIEKRNTAYAATAGIKKIRIHDFRHSHASLLANEGINIQEIARRLGHAKIEMTWNTYSHLYPREEERALAILNRI